VTKIRDEYELVTRGVREAQRDLDGLNDQYERGERSARELDEQLRDLNAEARRSQRANRRAARETKAFADAMRAGEKRAQSFRRDLDAARASAKRTAITLDQVKTAALGMGAAAAGVALLGKATFEAGQRGAKLLDFQANLERTTINVERLRAASSDTIPVEELLRATVFAEQYSRRLNLVGTSQQQLLESAVTLADAYDRDVTKSYKAVLDAVAGTTTGLRRQFGVVLDSTDVLEAYAAEIGKSVSSLSQFEKEAALSAAVQAKLNDAMASAPTKDFVTQFDRAETQLENFKSDIDQAVTVLLIDLVAAFREATGAAGKFYDAMSPAQQGDRNLKNAQQEVAAAATAVKRLNDELQALQSGSRIVGGGSILQGTATVTTRTAEEVQRDLAAANARLVARVREANQIGAAIDAGQLPGGGRAGEGDGGGGDGDKPPKIPIPPRPPRPQPTLQDIVGPSGATEADLLTLPDAQQEAQDQAALVDALRERLSVQRMMIETTREQTEATRILADVHRSFADALGQSAAAAIFEGESFIGALHNKLRSLAAFYTAQALGSLALGLVTGNPAAIAASAAYGKAALAATAGAILTGGLSSTFGGGSTGGGGAGGGAGGGPTPVDSFARSRERDRDRPVVVQVSIGGRDFDAVAHDAVARDTQQPRRGVSRVEVR